MMTDGSPMGGGLQLEGPATALNIAKRDQNLTPTTFHEFWLRTGDIPGEIAASMNMSVYLAFLSHGNHRPAESFRFAVS